MRSKLSLACLAAAALSACEPTTAGTNPNDTKTRLFCSIRVLDLLTDAANMDTFVAVENDEPQAFAAISPIGPSTQTPFTVTGFEQTATGDSTAYLSLDESALTSSSALTTTQGERFTLVETGGTAAGAMPPVAFTWFPETGVTVPSGQAVVRFVLGAPSLVGAQVEIGTATVASAAALGAMTPWTGVDPGSATLTVTPETGAAMSFTLPTIAAGALHTYAVADGPTATPIVLVDITETQGGDGTAAAPIAPTAP